MIDHTLFQFTLAVKVDPDEFGRFEGVATVFRRDGFPSDEIGPQIRYGKDPVAAGNKAMAAALEKIAEALRMA